jgi:hypothetical protein
MPHPTLFHLLILWVLVILPGCGIMTRVTDQLAERMAERMQQEVEKRMASSLAGLNNGILNHNDPATVLAGAPSYLIMLDSLLASRPDDPALLIASAKLYSTYADALDDQPERAKRLSLRARDYAARALCQRLPRVCRQQDKPFDQFKPSLNRITRADLAALFAYGMAWSSWLQARGDDWEAVAQLPKIDYVFTRITQLSPGYAQGRAQLYLAVLRSQIPPSLGGKTEIAKGHFDQALRHADKRDLMIKVKYARHYARMVYDQELHDRLLKEVLEADPQAPQLTLSNVMAQQEATRLQSDDYF